MSNIFTTSDLTSYMQGKATDATLATTVTNAVNQWVENRTHRCWGDTVTVTDELYQWNNVVWLRHQDIQEITAVKLGWPGQSQSTVDASAYYLNPLGRLTFYSNANRNMSRLYSDYLHVSYIYGVAEVPDDLKLAALGVAAGYYNWALSGNKDVVATSVGSYRVQYSGSIRPTGNQPPDPANNTTDANWAVIDSYRLRRS